MSVNTNAAAAKRRKKFLFCASQIRVSQSNSYSII
jgi:hypothetical protein